MPALTLAPHADPAVRTSVTCPACGVQPCSMCLAFKKPCGEHWCYVLGRYGTVLFLQCHICLHRFDG